MKKILFSAILIFFVTAALVHAENSKVLYLIKTELSAQQPIINNLQSLGFTVEKALDADIGRVNMSSYAFIVVNNDAFINYQKIPINSVPALILNSHYMDEWHWVRYISQKASSQPLSGYVTDSTYYITYGMSYNVQLYSQASYDGSQLVAYYLDKYVKAASIKSVVGTGDSPASDLNNAYIATVMPGALLRDGVYSNVKSVFFGLAESEFWTPNAAKLFRNSALWLVTDTTAPRIVALDITEVTNSTARIGWETDDDSNATVRYGKTTALANKIELQDFTQLHELYLTGIQEKTTYYFNITSCNTKNYCKRDGPFTFTTLDMTPPKLTSVTVTGTTNSSVNISISTDEQSNGAIYYGTSELSQMVLIGHSDQFSIEIGNLFEKTTYNYIIELCDDSNNCINSSIMHFTTSDFTPPSAPVNLTLEVANNNGIKVRWLPPAGEIPSGYNIYIADKIESFNFEKANVSVASLEYLDNSAPSSKKRYYIVRAKDASGNEDQNTNIVAKYDLGLDAGYNSVSFPLMPFSNNIAKVMHQSVLYQPVSEVVRYKNGHMEFIRFQNDSWNQSISLYPLEGYFFKSAYAADFTIAGYPIDSKAIDLEPGLNFVGLALLEDKEIKDIFPQTNYSVLEIASWNYGTYELATYYPSIDDWLDPFLIQPGKSYWVNSKINLEVNIK
jgi:hypothetical protein